MDENENLDNIDTKNYKGNLDKILEFLKDPSSKELKDAFISFLNKAMPNPIYKLIGDVAIGGLCFGVIILCAKWGFVEKSNVQSLLSLTVGAIIGARFKS